MTASSSPPSPFILVIAQLLSVVGEIFGQRASRLHYHHSNIRFLIMTTLYSSLQAAVVLTFTQLLLPHSTTGGQGTLSLPRYVFEHPMVWLNAINNTFYWIAQAYLLRLPFGVLVVVLGFLVASFVVAPVQELFDVSDGSSGLSPLAIALGYTGAVMCLLELQPLVWARVCGVFGVSVSDTSGHTRVDEETLLHERGHPETMGFIQEPDGVSDSYHVSSSGLRVRDQEPLLASADGGVHSEADSDSVGAVSSSSEGVVLVADRNRAPLALSGIVGAWAVLVVTTVLGIVFTAWFERKIGMTMFGYAACDQILLPVTTIPMLMLFNRFDWLRDIVEPKYSPRESFVDVCRRAWREFRLAVMVVFRSTMFAREFMFFWLITSFNMTSVYTEMTLMRIVMSWVASALVSSVARSFVGVTSSERRKVMQWQNLALKIVGSALVIAALFVMND